MKRIIENGELRMVKWALLMLLALALAACSMSGKANDDDDDGGIPQADDDDDSGDDDAADDDDSGDDDDDEMECWEVWAMCEYQYPADGVPDECGAIVYYKDTEPETWGPYAIYMACIETLDADWYGNLADCGESGGCADDWKDDSYRCHESLHQAIADCYLNENTRDDFLDCQPALGPGGDYNCTNI